VMKKVSTGITSARPIGMIRRDVRPPEPDSMGAPADSSHPIG